MFSETVIRKKEETLLNQVSIVEWLEAVPAGIILLDVKGMILYANNIAKELFNLLYIGQSWESALEKNVKGISDNGHYIVCHSRKHVMLKTQALPDKKGQIILLLDGSELKESFESKIKLEKIDSIGKLSAALAHQLRTPLSTAMLYTSNLVLDNVSKEDIKNYQERILKQLNLIKQQIEDVLLVHNGKESVLEKIDMVAEVLSLIEDFQELYPHMEFKINTPSTLATIVLANRQSLRGALNNILDNAVYASTEHHKIDIEIVSDQENVIVNVIDYGQGMSQDVIAKVTKGFYSTKDTGNGLGLSIARSVIEAHQGKLLIKSEVMRYTKISIMIPVIKD